MSGPHRLPDVRLNDRERRVVADNLGLIGATLNRYGYRGEWDDADERHICPLQLDLIERCIRLWSNEGETVLSPFAGIGSEGYEAIKLRRQFVGCELKPSYWRTAADNLARAEAERDLPSLFDEVDP